MQKREVFLGEGGRPSKVGKGRQFFLISYTFGAFYSIFEGGSTFLYDFFALGAFSRRVALFCKPWAF